LTNTVCGTPRRFATEREAGLVDVHDHADRAGHLDKLNHRQPDRTRADDQHVLAGAHPGPVHRVAADGEGFHQRQLFKAERPRNMQLARRQQHALAHATVTHHPERLMLFATVGQSPPAGVTALAVDVRFDRTAVARPDVLHPGAHRENLDAELMSRNPWIRIERHLAEVTTVVGAADTDPVDADQGLARAGAAGSGISRGRKDSGFSSCRAFMVQDVELNCFRATPRCDPDS
jgi:hypothetical protein